MMDRRLQTDHLYQGSYVEPIANEVCTCDICGYGINEGDDYYEIDSNNFCDDCINDYRKTATKD